MKRMLMLLLIAANAFPAEPKDPQEAIRRNELAWLRGAVMTPGFADQRDGRGNGPLLWAAAYGSAAALEILLDAGADPNQANSLGITPLIAAATEPAKVKLLLAKGAKVEAKSQIGQQALTVAAASPQASESVRLLLAAGADVNARGARGTTALLAAMGTACAAENARLLLAAGADVKALDGAGFGVMHGVASCPVDLLAEMLKRGANVNQQNTLTDRVKKGEILLKGISPLMLAAAHREPAVIELLLKAGADVNAVDIRGMTPLHYAAASEARNAKTLKMLLAAGARPEVRDHTGQSAGDWARKYNDPEKLAVLKVGASWRVSAPAAKPGPGPATALERLEVANETFFAEGGCSSCHHSSLVSLAAEHASRHGMKVNEELAVNRTNRIRGMLMAFSSALQQMVPPPGETDTGLYLLLEAQSLGMKPTAELEALARYVYARQMPDGSFTLRGISRSPLEEHDLHRTALALYVLPRFQNIVTPERMKQAAEWLAAQPARTNDEMAMKLLGLHWAGAPAQATREAAKRLAASMRTDGGFGGNPWLPSDNHSTALARYALREAGGLTPEQAVMRRSRAFLEERQQSDGTWYQASRAAKFQPYFESGFPYGHDQWVSAAATAWGVLALVD